LTQESFVSILNSESNRDIIKQALINEYENHKKSERYTNYWNIYFWFESKLSDFLKFVIKWIRNSYAFPEEIDLLDFMNSISIWEHSITLHTDDRIHLYALNYEKVNSIDDEYWRHTDEKIIT